MTQCAVPCPPPGLIHDAPVDLYNTGATSIYNGLRFVPHCCQPGHVSGPPGPVLICQAPCPTTCTSWCVAPGTEFYGSYPSRMSGRPKSEATYVGDCDGNEPIYACVDPEIVALPTYGALIESYGAVDAATLPVVDLPEPSGLLPLLVGLGALSRLAARSPSRTSPQSSRASPSGSWSP